MEIASAFVTIRPDASSFEAELVAAISGIGEQDISVTAETGVAASDMDAFMADYFNLDVDVDADTSAAVAAVESIPDGEVEVTANTEQADAALDQVKEKVEETTDSTSKLGEAAQGALTGMGGLSGAAGGAANALGASAVAGGAAAVGLFSFAQAAIDAESAEQRFELTTGSLGGELRTIDVGGISGDIGELALKLGSSDEAMLNATSSFVSFAQSTGAADDEIVTTSGDINALALRAVALNPALGDAGAVAERMTNALARGGRATTAFGIGLTSAEINARAMADTGKTNTTELTQFEKAAAGAAIAVERLGSSMGEDFAAGSQNARTEWNRMTESLGEASEQVGSTMLPAIENITEAVTELASGIANLDIGSVLAGLWDISGPGLFINGLTDLSNAVTGTNREVDAQATVVEGSSTAWASAAEQVTTYEQAQTAASDAIAGTLPTLSGVIGEVDRAGDAFGVLNASSDPQAIIDNLGLALFAWDDFQANISTVSQWGPNIAAALQQLGPEVAGGLTNALAQGNAATIVQLDGLIAEITERGGQASAVLTGFAQNGMDGAVAAVQSSTGPMGAAGTAAGASGAAGIDAGLTYTNAAAIGAITGTQYGAGVSSGISGMYSTINAVANNVIAGAGNIGSAYSRGQALGSAYGSGIVAGLAGQIGRAAATRASLDAVVESTGREVGATGKMSAAPTTIVHQTVMPNGDVLAESVFDVARRVAIAEGYEQ